MFAFVVKCFTFAFKWKQSVLKKKHFVLKKNNIT